MDPDTDTDSLEMMDPDSGFNESGLGCALTFASEAKFEIEAKISFRLEAKKPDST
jgi:hypothetical protein